MMRDNRRHAHRISAGNDMLHRLLIPLSTVEQVLLSRDTRGTARDTIGQAKTLLDDGAEIGQGLEDGPVGQVLGVCDDGLELGC